MKIIRSIETMFKFSRQSRFCRKSIGFIPTMGAMHAGHLSLIKKARQDNDLVVVSIFVNPIQFGPEEDFKKYPRNLKEDARLCKKEGVDILFFPSKKEMYPTNYKTFVYVSQLSTALCGKSRPGHFQGVTTIVLKLLNIVQPDVAYFGQKDAQQATIIKKMASDLNIPVFIKVMPTLREKNGLALSSRNKYLNAREKEDAAVLFEALNAARKMVSAGIKDSAKIIKRMKKIILKVKTARIDYISIVHLDNLNPVSRVGDKCLIALAVRIGKARLIDNIIIK